MTIRFEAGFPANGRSVNAGELIKMLFDFVPEAVDRALFYAKVNHNALQKAIELAEDQQYIREHLEEKVQLVPVSSSVRSMTRQRLRSFGNVVVTAESTVQQPDVHAVWDGSMR